LTGQPYRSVLLACQEVHVLMLALPVSRSQNMHEYWRSLQGTECKQWQFAEEDGAVKAYNGRMDGADAVCRH